MKEKECTRVCVSLYISFNMKTLDQIDESSMNILPQFQAVKQVWCAFSEVEACLKIMVEVSLI